MYNGVPPMHEIRGKVGGVPLYMELDPMQEPKTGPLFVFQLIFRVKERFTFFFKS